MKLFNSLVLGDLIIDILVNCENNRLNPESSAPLLEKKNEIITLGGVGNAIDHLYQKKNFNFDTILNIGSDKHKINISKIIQKYKKINITTHWTNSKNIIKRRYVSKSQHVLRVDENKILPNGKKFNKLVLENIKKKKYEYALLLDYCKGAFEKKHLINVLNHLKKINSKIIVDSKSLSFPFYNLFALKFNYAEAIRLLDFHKIEGKNFKQKIKIFKSQFNIENLIVTKSRDGCILMDKNNLFSEFKSKNISVYDVTGAGDIFISEFFYQIIKNSNIKRALHYATNIATESVKVFGLTNNEKFKIEI